MIDYKQRALFQLLSWSGDTRH